MSTGVSVMLIKIGSVIHLILIVSQIRQFASFIGGFIRIDVSVSNAEAETESVVVERKCTQLLIRAIPANCWCCNKQTIFRIAKKTG